MAAAGVDLGERGGPAGLQGRRSALRRQQRQRQQRQRRGPPAPHRALLRVLPVLPEPRSAPLRLRQGSEAPTPPPPIYPEPGPARAEPPRLTPPHGAAPAPPAPAGGAEAVPAPGRGPGQGGPLSLSLPFATRARPTSSCSPSPSAGSRCWGRPGHLGAALPAAPGHRSSSEGGNGRGGDPGAAGGDVTPALQNRTVRASMRLHLGQRGSLSLAGNENLVQRAYFIFQYHLNFLSQVTVNGSAFTGLSAFPA